MRIFGHFPLSLPTVAILMSDRGIPKTWRHMHGISLVTPTCGLTLRVKKFFVKYHFKTDQGIECLTQEEADKIAGSDADYHRREICLMLLNEEKNLVDVKSANYALR